MATFYRVPTGDEVADAGTVDGGRPAGDGGVMPPVPPPATGSDDGCSVAPGAHADARGVLFALALAAFFGARRRRR